MVYGLWFMVYDLWFMVLNLKWRDLVFGWVCVHDERTLKPVAIQRQNHTTSTTQHNNTNCKVANASHVTGHTLHALWFYLLHFRLRKTIEPLAEKPKHKT